MFVGSRRLPAVTSGVYLGAPAMNSRGLRSAEIQEVGRIVVEALTTEPSEDDMGRLLKHGLTLTAAFPLYPSLEA